MLNRVGQLPFLVSVVNESVPQLESTSVQLSTCQFCSTPNKDECSPAKLAVTPHESAR